ncbi:MAG: hypothetical protein OEV73_00540 [Desulfobulbaceae bacterium]|nr:hypothetical protein [Desulfobulbaceae bacterium]
MIDWLLNHWQDILTAISGVVTAASIIVKLTPTPADDAALARVLRLLDLLALNPKR